MSALAVTQPTMSSLDLLNVINTERQRFNESIVRRNDFHARVRDELEGEHYESFVVDNGNGTETEAYRLTLKQCMYVAMRESKGVRRTVQQHLESKNAPAIQVPTTLTGALRLALEQAEKIEQQQAQLEAAKPAVEFVGRFVQAEGLKGFREVCKLLKANEARFTDFVLSKKIMYRLAGKLTAHQPHIDAGRFEVRAGVAAANEHAYTTTKFTPKGTTWIAGEWAKYCFEKETAGA